MRLIVVELAKIIDLLMEEGVWTKAVIWKGYQDVPITSICIRQMNGIAQETYLEVSTEESERAWYAPTLTTRVILELVATDIPRITLVCPGYPASIVDLRGNDAIGFVDKVRKLVNE